MTISRRLFLGLTAAMASTAPAFSATDDRPVLHGDGIHDDTEALQAIFRGDEVLRGGETVRAEPGRIVDLPDTYLISDTIRHRHDLARLRGKVILA